MANLFSDGNAVAAEIVLKEFGLRLADRSFIGSHPVLDAGFLGKAQGAGTLTKSLISLGDGTMAAVAENVAASAVDFDYTDVSVTVARRATGRAISAMQKAIDATGAIRDPVALSYDAVQILQNTYMALMCAAGVTATGNVGTSGSDCTWGVIDDAIGALEDANNDVSEGIIIVLHPEQWKNLRGQSTSGTGLSDPAAWGTYDKTMAAKMGYKGNFRGADLYVSPRLTTANAGADVQGFAFCKHGLVHAHAPIAPNPQRHELLLDGGHLQLAFDSDGSKAMDNAWYNAFIGVALGVDASVVKITTDAP
jgi:hypothetical protein